MSPFWVANISFLCWPLVTAILFARLPVLRATIWTILGGFLFLPADLAIKFAMIPQFDKASIPSLCALIGCRACGIKVRPWTRFGIVEFLMVIYLLIPLATSWGNGDSFAFGDRFVPGVGWYDAISAVISQAIELLPFILARQLVRTSGDVMEIFRAIVLGTLIYSVPVLIEIRMSPQVSNWIYGFQASFNTEVRYGGYRPVVFMNNGLMLSFFVMTGVISAIMLWIHRQKIGQWSTGPVAAYLGLVLVLCKSAGALLYAIVLVPLLLFARFRAQSRVAVALAVLALAYPLLKANDLFPDKTLLDIAAAVNEERAQSLETRFDQEGSLLKHASERFFLGWGRFGRSRVYDEYYAHGRSVDHHFRYVRPDRLSGAVRSARCSRVQSWSGVGVDSEPKRQSASCRADAIGRREYRRTIAERLVDVLDVVPGGSTRRPRCVSPGSCRPYFVRRRTAADRDTTSAVAWKICASNALTAL
jgi:hypothetical protein